ncbi:acetyl-CoA carboxylase biotin carboxyl carrier protein [Gluconobacter sphaericus]|uniref:acetyl-CoA carboxylase biotin carboxyl carrier protein n=1 Tax=Gluconobacter sphaericus TaxID=574987 RepID=UPI00312B8953
MDLSQIRRLIDLMAQAPIAELEIEENGRRVRLVKAQNGQRAVAAKPAEATPVVPQSSVMTPASDAQATITAPSYGVFHLAPSPDASSYVVVGQNVEAGQQVGLLEAMKVFNPVRAGIAGTIEAVLVAGGTEVDMGTPLFRLV